jgi:hypothetical protein
VLTPKSDIPSPRSGQAAHRKSKIRRVLPYALFGLLAIQLVPLSRSNPPVTRDFDGPAEVERVLRQSCYDCHSNETVWGWTAYIAPGSWLVVRDVHKARDEFNLSEWDRIDADDRQELRAEMVEEVDDGEMPLRPYLMIHPEARVSEADLAVLRTWAGPAADDDRDGRRRRRGRDH